MRNVKTEVIEKTPGSRVIFELAFMPNGDEKLLVEVREEMLEWSVAEWLDFLARQV